MGFFDISKEFFWDSLIFQEEGFLGFLMYILGIFLGIFRDSLIFPMDSLIFQWGIL